MPNYTTNLNLVKPLVTEQYDIAKVTNDNADIIDDAIHDLELAKQDIPTVEKTTPIDADMVLLLDSADLNKAKKLSWSNVKETLKTYFDALYQSILVSGTNIKTINGNSVLGSGDLVIATSSDWNIINATLTYASADSPTFVANTSIDLTSVISVGMKIKLTQTTVKYFIVTAITSTTITLYGGTDYTLANATITLPYFSSMKAPYGFPMNPDKWSVIVTVSTNQVISNPTPDTWYSLTSANITIPIGLWSVYYQIQIYMFNSTSVTLRGRSTLSTTNNSETITSLTRKVELNGTGVGQTLYAINQYIERTSKAIHYLLIQAQSETYATLTSNATGVPLIIKAVCAYL